MAKARTQRKLDGLNAIPEEIANEGFAILLNPEPIYYSPAGASMLVCVLTGRHAEIGKDLKGKEVEKVYYDAICLADFQNGTLEDGTPQPNAKRGEMIRLGEKHQFQQLRQYVGRAVALGILPKGKIKLDNGQTCWTFAIYGKPLDPDDKALVLQGGMGAISAPLLTD